VIVEQAVKSVKSTLDRCCSLRISGLPLREPLGTKKLRRASVFKRFISVVVITLDFDYGITFQQPRFEPGMDLSFLCLLPGSFAGQTLHWRDTADHTNATVGTYETTVRDQSL
jgi:hypothetical protein